MLDVSSECPNIQEQHFNNASHLAEPEPRIEITHQSCEAPFLYYATQFFGLLQVFLYRIAL